MLQQAANTSINAINATPLKIGIIGAGFSGTALAATLARLTQQFSHRVITLTLFEKTGQFGQGHAYRTPFPFHLLNVRAHNMSAFEEDPDHFVHWLTSHPSGMQFLEPTLSYAQQFAPRMFYGEYLQSLLKNMHQAAHIELQLEANEVINVTISQTNKVILTLQDGRTLTMDKVVFTVGNNQPAIPPFPVAEQMNIIANPWDYTAPCAIPPEDDVLIVGTGLSMIDAVLTLHHHHHQGKIYAISRHGLLPLPHVHTEIPETFSFDSRALPATFRELMRYIRTASKQHMQTGGNWVSVMTALRSHIATMWCDKSVIDKKRFLRHILVYWNVHRHRVHRTIKQLLDEMQATKQLEIMAGRVLSVTADAAVIQLRGHQQRSLPIKWLMNCMGPSLSIGKNAAQHPLWLQALLREEEACFDPLHIGLEVAQNGALKNKSGQVSRLLYTMGPPARAAMWECTAVPDIRKQCLVVAKELLGEADRAVAGKGF